MTRGSATLLGLSLIGLIVSISLAVALVVSAGNEGRKTQHMADLAALAAADVDQGVAPGIACDFARQLVARMGEGRVSCAVMSAVAGVSVTTEWQGFDTTRSARAQPFEPTQ